MEWDECFSTVAGAADVATIKCFEVVVAKIIGAVSGIAAIVFFLMLIFGGFRYLTSAGNPKATEAAKGTLTAAFLGVVLLIVAYLVLILLKSFTGVNLTEFVIPEF